MIMDFHQILLYVQHSISLSGVLVILSGVLIALCRYIKSVFLFTASGQQLDTNSLRLSLGKVLLLGLEFIVAADLIGTTTAPDYYSIGIVACIVTIRTVLSFTLNKEIASLSAETTSKI
jgi:uncharacterized membrane protein